MPKYSIRGTTHYECDTCGVVRHVLDTIGTVRVGGRSGIKVRWALIRPAADRHAHHTDPANEEVFIVHCPWCRQRLTMLEGRDPELVPTLPLPLPPRVPVWDEPQQYALRDLPPDIDDGMTGDDYE